MGFIKSMVGFAESGFQTTPSGEYQHRLSVCSSCDQLKNSQCQICKCFVIAKAAIAVESCPIDRWSSVSGITISQSINQIILSHRGCGGCQKPAG